MADDLELRWRLIRKTLPFSHYAEITWSNSYELAAGMKALDELLGCDADWKEEVNHEKKHVAHKKNQRSCKDEIISDLDYRRIMSYDDRLQKILFQDPVQVIHDKECINNHTILQEFIKKEHYSLDEFQWN